MRGLAQSFLKSILALWARDNSENIIQNSTFQHVSSIKGGFLSRVSTKATWPKNAQIRLKKERESTYFFQTKASLATCVDKCVFYVCADIAHAYLHTYQLEPDALNKLQFLLMLMLFFFFSSPILTICVLPHNFWSKVLLHCKDWNVRKWDPESLWSAGVQPS